MNVDAGADARSLFWCILRNDLRLYWRGNATRKLAWATGFLARLGFLLLIHLFCWGMFAVYANSQGGPAVVCAAVLALLGMSSLHRALEVLYNRGDLTLLLASPVPARVVLQTRLVDVVLTCLFDTMTLVLPLTNVAIALYGWQWAWAFVVWLAVVLAVVPAAVLVTILAVERLGAARARTVVQVLGLFCGMGTMLLTQLPQFMQAGASRAERTAAREAIQNDLFGWFQVPPLEQLAAAASGAWPWLLPLVVAAPLLFFLAQRTLAVRFVEGAQGAAADVGGKALGSAAAGAAWRGAFERPRWRVLVRTQLLLLRRDPLLLMRCAMQIVSLVPMLLVAFMAKAAAGFGGLGVMAAAIVPLQLAALRNANDEANEFEAASPLRPRERAWMRAVAAALPMAVFAVVMGVVTGGLAGFVPGLMVVVGGAVNALAAGWLGTCTTRVHSAEERGRNRQPRLVWQMLLGMLFGGLAAAGVGVVMSPKPWIGWVLFAVGLAIAAGLFQIEPRPAVEDDG